MTYFHTKSIYSYLNFILQFCPTHPSEKALIARFAKIGIAAGAAFNPDLISPEIRVAIEEGFKDGQAAIDIEIAGMTSAAAYFGTRAFMKNNYLNRAAGAQAGIYGNSVSEAVYLPYRISPPYDASKTRYTLRFAKGDLPPTRAFWSLTMYDGKTQLLIANSLNQYLINSTMESALRRDADGGITLYVQSDSPGKDKEANWLPAPNGPFYTVLRIYQPKVAAQTGKWVAPRLVPVN